MTLEHPVGRTGGNVSEIGLPYLLACGRICLPAFLELALVLADPVLVVGNVGRNAVGKVLADIVAPAELELDTAVGNLGDVLSRSSRITHHHKHRRGVENAVCKLVVNIDCTGEPVPEESEVDSDIGYRGGLPGQCIILDGSDGDTVGQIVSAEYIVCGTVCGLPVVVADGVVAELTPGETDLEVVHLACLLEPRLLADTPSCRE